MKRGAWCSVVVAAVLVTAAEVVSGGPAREARQAHLCSSGLQCVQLSTCRSFLGPDNKPDPTLMRRLGAEFCQQGFSQDPKVCCPQVESTTPPGTSGGDLLPAQCGRPGENRIVHGTVAAPNEYPWMVLLGYGSGSNIAWDCGGVLISDRYVLTAAHCVHTDFTFGATLSTVRLGEHNTETDPDCPRTGPRPCAAPHQDFRPETITLHETFHKRSPVSDDIALIRLDRKATLGDTVVPVCVPTEGLHVPTFLAGRKGVVAGWGATENSTRSSVLRKVQVPYAEKTVCEPHYPGQLVAEQVCFGGQGNQDSCYGDSGGPLFQVGLHSLRYNVLGLVSRGKGECGTDGVPAVYTNVASYRSWIQDNMRP